MALGPGVPDPRASRLLYYGRTERKIPLEETVNAPTESDRMVPDVHMAVLVHPFPEHFGYLGNHSLPFLLGRHALAPCVASLVQAKQILGRPPVRGGDLLDFFAPVRL